MEITREEAKEIVTRLGPSLGCGDFTYDPVFPKDRRDVCAVRRMAENGSTYGFDTIYLLWKGQDGTVCHLEVTNSRTTKDYIHVDKVTVEGDKVTVKYGSGGSYSGTPWKRSTEIPVRVSQ